MVEKPVDENRSAHRYETITKAQQDYQSRYLIDDHHVFWSHPKK
jgi:hypothetical protein